MLRCSAATVLTVSGPPQTRVIDLYVSARSQDVMNNAFFLVYHHIIGKLQAAAPPNEVRCLVARRDS